MADELFNQRRIRLLTIVNDFTRESLAIEVGVPGDLTIPAYDLTPALDSLRIPITTLDQPVVELAENAAAAVARRLQTPGAPPLHVTLGFRLNVRQ